MSPRKKIGRRAFTGRFLGGAAAVGGASMLPWLEMFQSRARAQSALPKRLVLITVGHSPDVGNDKFRYWLPENGGPLPTELPELLTPLEPFRNRMLVLGGLDNIVQRIVEGNNHHRCALTALTGMPHADALTSNGDLKSSVPSIGNGTDTSGGPSFDQALADALGVRPLTLRVGKKDNEHRFSFRADGSLDRGEANPAEAFATLFGGGQGSAPSTPLEHLASRRVHILDTVRRNYADIARRAGREDRLRLEQHAEHIRAFAEELDQTVEIVCSDPSLQEASPGLPSSGFEDGNGPHDDVIARTHNSLIATTLACQATRVVSMQFTNKNNNQFPFLNGGSPLIRDGWHGVVHHSAGTDEQRLRAMRWFFDVTADLLAKLEAIPEGDGTLLDDTLVVWTALFTDAGHGTKRLPVLAFGPPGGPLNAGICWRPSESNLRSHNDLFTTLFNAMGVPATSFGWDKGDRKGLPFSQGAIEDLLT